MSTKDKAKYTLSLLFGHVLIYTLIQKISSSQSYNLFTPVDNWIPLVPEFVWIYHTLVPVILFTSIILVKKRCNFFATWMSGVLAAVILNLCYVALPCSFPREELDNSTISNMFLNITRILDEPKHTFPSTHVTFSWIMYYAATSCQEFIKDRKYIKWSYFVWASLISCSTVFLKQHFIVDVIAGMILAYICFYISVMVVDKYKDYFLKKE